MNALPAESSLAQLPTMDLTTQTYIQGTLFRNLIQILAEILSYRQLHQYDLEQITISLWRVVKR